MARITIEAERHKRRNGVDVSILTQEEDLVELQAMFFYIVKSFAVTLERKSGIPRKAHLQLLASLIIDEIEELEEEE